MPHEPRTVGRRRFLAGTAGLSTYTLFVRGPAVPDAGADERTPEEIRDSFETLAPLDPAEAARRFEGEPNMTLVDLAHVVRAPQPETVPDYVISVHAADGQTVEVARVEGNHQRLRRHDFEPLDATEVRVHVTATNGSENASLYEVRCCGA